MWLPPAPPAPPNQSLHREFQQNSTLSHFKWVFFLLFLTDSVLPQRTLWFRLFACNHTLFFFWIPDENRERQTLINDFFFSLWADSCAAESAVERKTGLPLNPLLQTLDKASVPLSPALSCCRPFWKHPKEVVFVLFLLAASYKRDVTILEPPFFIFFFHAKVKDDLSFAVKI